MEVIWDWLEYIVIWRTQGMLIVDGMLICFVFLMFLTYGPKSHNTLISQNELSTQHNFKQQSTFCSVIQANSVPLLESVTYFINRKFLYSWWSEQYQQSTSALFKRKLLIHLLQQGYLQVMQVFSCFAGLGPTIPMNQLVWKHWFIVTVPCSILICKSLKSIYFNGVEIRAEFDLCQHGIPTLT